MGTTKTAITDGSNPQLAVCLTIEGYNQIITDHRADLSAVVTAYAATAYTSAISGLTRKGLVVEQSIVPLRPRIEAVTTTFTIFPDENETLFVDVFASNKAGGVTSKLNATTTPSATSLVMTGDTGNWTGSEGYIGTERFEFSGESGSTITGVTRGKPAPFARSAGGGVYGRSHRVSSVPGGVVSRPVASSYPKRWIGKWVACRVHRVVDGVLDVTAQSELIFSGRISDIVETEAGALAITCLDARDAIESAVLLTDQYTCTPTEGLFLRDDSTFKVRRVWEPLSIDEFTYTIGGGDGELTEGFHNLDEIVDSLNEWFAGRSWSTAGGAGDWTVAHVGSDSRVTIRTKMSEGGITSGLFKVEMTGDFCVALGFDVETENREGSPPYRAWYLSSDQTAVGGQVIAGVTGAFAGGFAPRFAYSGSTWTVELEKGSFVDQASWLPQPWKNLATAESPAGVWGFVRLGEFVYLAEYVSATPSLTVYWDNALLEAFQVRDPWQTTRPVDELTGLPGSNNSVFRINEELPEIRQIILMEEPNFEDWLIKTFASTGTTSYNHANDVYPETLGLAIPWELLDGDFVNSVTALGGDDDFRVLIEKPTLFSSILLPELTLRNAHLCFRDGKIVITRPSVIDAASATHTLTTSHKAAATPDDASRDRTRSQRSRSSIVNVLKVEYDRDFEGNYHRVTEVTNEQSRSDYGQSQPITIQARNSLRLKPGHAEESARQLIASLSGDMLSFHSEPSPLVSRSINPAAWFVTPGDTVSLSDDSVRSSTTGLRGVTVATGWITRIVQDWGTGIGEIDIVLRDEAQSDGQAQNSIYAPAGLLDSDKGSTVDGYAVAGPYIWLEANEFSLSAEEDDITHFAVNDVITIQERSPLDPTTPVAWVRTIAAIGTPGGENQQRITLSSTLTSPAFPGNGESYYVYSDDYAATTSTQKIDCFIGDDADGNIVDSAPNRAYVQQDVETGTYTAANTTDRVEWTPTDGSWGNEGEPVHPPMHRALVTYGNNLINRRTSPQSPFFFFTPASTTSTSYVLAAYPVKYFLGRGEMTSLLRALQIGPSMQQTTGGTGSVRVTSSLYKPTSATAIGSEPVMTFTGPKSQAVWANASTSWANVAAADLQVWPRPGREFTWITVEIKTTANTCNLHGFHEWWLGPLA